MNGTAITIPTAGRTRIKNASDMSLRILHVTPYFTDAWAYGGIPRLATTLTTGLVRRGHRVTVCTTDVCDRLNRLPTPSPTPSPAGLDVRVFPNWSNRLAYELQVFTPRGLGRYLAATDDSLTSPTSTATGMGSKWWRRAGVAGGACRTSRHPTGRPRASNGGGRSSGRGIWSGANGIWPAPRRCWRSAGPSARN